MGNRQWAIGKRQNAKGNQSRLVKAFRNAGANSGGKGRVKQIIDQHETLGGIQVGVYNKEPKVKSQ